MNIPVNNLNEATSTKYFKSVEDLSKHMHKSIDKLEADWNKVSKKLLLAIKDLAKDTNKKDLMPIVSCFAEVTQEGFEVAISLDYSKLTNNVKIKNIIQTIHPLIASTNFRFEEGDFAEAILITEIITKK